MSKDKPEAMVSVVIVNLNTRDLLRRCLSSIDKECEVIVVDNASSDGSVEMVRSEFPNALLVANQENVGFGPANNQGIAIATRPLVLLLNSDAYATPETIRTLAQCFEDPQVVACGGKLLHLDGRLQESCCSNLTIWAVVCEQLFLEKLFHSSRLFSPYWQSSRLVLKPGAIHFVEQVMGACLMMRPIERFDERFFLYCEDTELCYRLRSHGKIGYVPDAVFFHELGASSPNRWRAIALYNHGKELYFSIHHGMLSTVRCWLLNRLGALVRLLIWSSATLLTLGLFGRFRRQALCFVKVLFSPVKGPRTPFRKHS